MDVLVSFLYQAFEWIWHRAPFGVVILLTSVALAVLFSFFWAVVYCLAPLPRPPFASEVRYKTASRDGSIVERQLPHWQEEWLKKRSKTEGDTASAKDTEEVEKAEVLLTVVVPAYNEEDRLGIMLDEALDVLEREYPSTASQDKTALRKRHTQNSQANGSTSTATNSATGWEILVVSDGSKDKTVPIALEYARKHPDDCIRVITLKRNRGKGGAVTHGMRHARGQYIMFADADGASKFSDETKLMKACVDKQDKQGRIVAVGSRAHLVGSEAVVQRSALRNFLMHSFHLLLWLLTPQATSRIRDTQCGFKMFSRAALPYIVPHMHSEGWIFDVEMLMLAERAGIPMVEVPIGWHEVKGSKLNVLWDSLGMAWGLGILRLAWGLGVYRT